MARELAAGLAALATALVDPEILSKWIVEITPGRAFSTVF
jgi:hypothetical protein